MTTQTFTLPAGTICQRGGIPFALVTDTVIECHPGNWPLIQKGFVPSVSQLAHAAADRGEALAEANVFATGTDAHRNFRSDYLQRQNALDAVAG